VRHVGLILCLAIDGHGRQPQRTDIAKPEVGLLHEQLQLARSRVGVDGRLLQRAQIECPASSDLSATATCRLPPAH
jgi:hypothetical protein